MVRTPQQKRLLLAGAPVILALAISPMLLPQNGGAWGIAILCALVGLGWRWRMMPWEAPVVPVPLGPADVGGDQSRATPHLPGWPAGSVVLADPPPASGRVRETDTRGSAIIEWSSDGVVLLDPELTMTVFNRSALELTGMAGLGRPCREVLRCRDAAGQLLCDTACPARRSFAGERLPDRELRLLDPSGHDRWVSASFAPVAPFATAAGGIDMADGAEPREVVVVLRDITARKAVEAMQSEFVASVSHELRAPLASIKAYTEILMEDAAPQSLHASFLATIDHETDYLTGLIDNLLNIARIEGGRLRPQSTAVYLSSIVAGAVPVFAPQMAARELTWAIAIADDLPAIRGDQDLLTILVKNLISNAIKYNRQGGVVMIEAEAAPRGGVRLTVGDEGLGLAPQECEHVFEKFYRVASTTQSGIKGSGLGLYLVRQIAALHGGAVTVESAPDIGSLFTVTLTGALADAAWTSAEC